MKKIFTTPECEVLLLNEKDVIATSVYNGDVINIDDRDQELDLPFLS